MFLSSEICRMEINNFVDGNNRRLSLTISIISAIMQQTILLQEVAILREFIIQKLEEIRNTENCNLEQSIESLKKEIPLFLTENQTDQESLNQLILQALVSDISPLSDDEKIDLVAADILRRFKPAFIKLAE